MSRSILEICVDSTASALAARAGGADRLELCADLSIGGTTPSLALVRQVKAETGLPVRVLLRPRAGDFCYDRWELAQMEELAAALVGAGADGIVTGVLTPEGDLDLPAMERICQAARQAAQGRPVALALHRAFDVCRDPFEALERLIELGCDRVLTSGQQSDAVKGIPLIAELVKRAGDRIIIMPGCGVRENNIACIEAETGAREFHTSARSVVYSKMEYRNENVPMGSSVVTSEFETVQTDRNKVKAFV